MTVDVRKLTGIALTSAVICGILLDYNETFFAGIFLVACVIAGAAAMRQRPAGRV